MKISYAKIKEKSSVLFNSKLFILFLGLLGTLILANQCSLSLFDFEYSKTDSSVFRYFAFAISKGQIPYVDLFDHKGPLLYLINYLGFLINNNYSVWLIEWIFIFSTLYFIYLTAKLLCNKLFSVITVIISMCYLPTYLEGGNLVEEYAMPFIALSIYIFTDYFLNKKITLFRLLVCGISGGCVLMLRPNMTATWFIFPLFVAIYELKQKNIKVLIKYICFFVFGVLISVIPFFLYFASVGGLKEFFFAYITFNLKYASVDGSKNGIIQSINTFITPMVILSVVVTLYSICKKENTLFNLSYLLYILLSLYTIGMSGKTYPHYGMVLIPAFSYTVAFIMSKFKYSSFEKISIISTVAIVLFVSFHSPFVELVNNITKKEQFVRSKYLDAVTEYIKTNTKKDDRIIVIGNKNIIYVETERLSASKYSYQHPIVNASQDILDDFYNELKKEKPEMIVIPTEHKNFSGINDFIEKNNYTEVFKNWSHTVFQLKK